MFENTWTAIQTGWNHPLIELDGAWITPGKIVVGVSVFIIGVWAARLLSRLAAKRLVASLHVADGTASVLRTLINYCLVLVVVFIALQTAGVPLTAFTIFGGALAIGVGLGSQNILNNFISGLIILIERPVRPGHLIQISGQVGIVQRIGARATLLTDYKGIAHLVPNSYFLEQTVTNWHYTDDMVCASVMVGVAYGSDTALVKKLLEQVAKDHPKVGNTPVPRVLFNDFGNDALIFELLTWTAARRVIERRELESDLRFAIDTSFRTHGISIAFPQRDVHLDATTPIPVRMVSDPV